MNSLRVPIPKIDFNPPVYYCKRATKPFVLDGNLHKEFWEEAPFTSLFVDIEGDSKPKPYMDTQVKMLWDDENFYFGGILYGEEIWATLTERDCVIFQDNDFEIFIDPDSDTHGYFEFEMNALNTVWDLFLTKPYRDTGGRPLNGWDIKGLQSAVKIKGKINEINPDNKYWMVEVVIPFDALKEMAPKSQKPEVGDYYRVNFSRVQWHVDIVDGKYVKKDSNEENWVWSPTGLVNIHYPELWGFVFFTENGESYDIPEVEHLKWELRKYYYYEHRYYDRYGNFTKDISALDMEMKSSICPRIEISSRSFEISCLTKDGCEQVVISQDGKTSVLGQEEYERKLRKVPYSLMQEMNESEQECMKFLYEFMPLSDIADYDPDLFLKFVRHSLWVKENMHWDKTIDNNDFLNYVLQFRVNNEHLEFYSSVLYEELAPRIQGMTMEEAAIEVNYWCFEKATYQATNSRTGSPFTVIKNAFGRCGEESTFVVAALRSVGIPARQCYTPRWSHCDDNHAWVEVFTEKGWQFLGACEPEIGLNRGWFRLPASKAMLIHSRVLSNRCSEEVITKQTSRMTEINVLNRYAKTKKIMISIKDENNCPVQGAVVRFEVVNYCEFYPIAQLETDSKGNVSFVTGLGDLMIYAYKGNSFVYDKLDVTNEDHMVLTLKKEMDMVTGVEEWTLIPPKGGVEEEQSLTKEENSEQKRRNEKAIEQRKAFEETFFNETSSKERAKKFSCLNEEISDCLIKARGNYKEILTFLDENSKEKLYWKVKLLSALPQKDLTDTLAVDLEEHFIYSMKYQENLEEDIFIDHVMNPRIWIEKIRTYRKEIISFFTEEEQKCFKEEPLKLKQWMESNLHVIQDREYSNLNTSPEGILKVRGGNKISHKIFFVAVLRTLGIPAKIEKTDGKLAYYKNSQWQYIYEEEVDSKEYGKLHLTREENSNLEYHKNYTVSRYVNGYYKTLDLEEIDWENDRVDYTLEEGYYRVVTANRQHDESNRIRVSYCQIEKDKSTTVPLILDKGTNEKKQVAIEDYSLISMNKEQCNLYEFIDTKRIVCWIQPGAEPTEHLLNEIIELKEVYGQLSKEVILLIQQEEEFNDPTLMKACKEVSSLKVLIESSFSLDNIYEGFNMKDCRLPLAIITEDKQGIFGWCGYQVGIGQLLIESIN
ncbi:hypothetical protein AN1V17_09590 [Vallitalea sediminicola]